MKSPRADDYEYDESARGQLIGSVFDSSEKEVVTRPKPFSDSNEATKGISSELSERDPKSFKQPDYQD